MIFKKSIVFKYFILTVLFAVQTCIVSAQSQITGMVTSSDDGLGLIGVNIVVDGSGGGTITDIDGSYTINASPGDILVFSYTGFQRKEVTVGTDTKVDVVMDLASSMLDEVVVVGYGSMRKSDVTGSIISVRDDALTDVRSGNVI